MQLCWIFVDLVTYYTKDPTKGQLNTFNYKEKAFLVCIYFVFYRFSRASEFTSDNFHWSEIQLADSTITILLRQSKTDLFRHGYSITLQEISTVHLRVQFEQ